MRLRMSWEVRRAHHPSHASQRRQRPSELRIDGACHAESARAVAAAAW